MAVFREAKLLTSACRTTALDLCLQDKLRPLSVLPILRYALLIVGCHIALALTPVQAGKLSIPFGLETDLQSPGQAFCLCRAAPHPRLSR